MARKVKNTNNPELDGPAFFAAIAQIEQEKGIQKGRKDERLLLLKKLLKNGKMSMEEILVAWEIPEADWPKYRQLLAEQ